MFEVITAMNKELYEICGRKMIESFSKNFARGILLTVYTEEDFDHDFFPGVYWASLNDNREYRAFVSRHQDRPDQQNDKELTHGAVRFCGKSFAIFDHIPFDDTRYLVWLDSDTEVFNKMPSTFLPSLVKEGVYVTYLGRKPGYAETGFVIYDTKHPAHKEFMGRYRLCYVKDTIFDMKEWHDAYVFEILRNYILTDSEEYNLTPWGKNYDHVFINSVLGKYIDHMKGPRKMEGKSRSSDLTYRAPDEMKERLND